MEKKTETVVRYNVLGQWVKEETARKLYKELREEFDSTPTSSIAPRSSDVPVLRVSNTLTSVDKNKGHVVIRCDISDERNKGKSRNELIFSSVLFDSIVEKVQTEIGDQERFSF